MASPMVKIVERGDNTTISLHEGRGKANVVAAKTVMVKPTKQEIGDWITATLVEIRVKRGKQGRLIDVNN